MASLSQPKAINEAMSQLDSSGITFSIEYVGCVSVKISLNSKSVKVQNEIGESCIKSVARKAQKIHDGGCITDVNGILGELTLVQTEVDLNVTRKSLLLIDSNDIRPKVLRRLDIQNISLVVPGQNNVDDYFCFFAKCKDNGIEERKCFVFFAGEEKADVCRLLCIAFMTAGIMSNSDSRTLTPIDKKDTDWSGSKSPTNCLPASYRRGSDQKHNDAHSISSEELSEKENFRILTHNLEKERWFHGLMDRDMAETKVIRDRQFLVRESQNKPNQVILTGMQGSQVKHLCLIDSSGKLRTTEREFQSISELIQYYQTSLKPLSGDHQSELILRDPVYRSKN